jgi:putative lipoprotein
MVDDRQSLQIVTGEVVMPSVALPEAANLIVQVEEVSRADAPSLVVAEQRQNRVQLRPGAALPFVIEVPIEMLDERNSYSVRAHVDVSGSGEVEVGDLISTRSYPVLTRGHGDRASVGVQVV